MRVTINDLAANLNISRENIEQVDSKQLFIVTTSNNTANLYSYYMKVGELNRAINTWTLTVATHSQTTSKQLTKFAKSRRKLGYTIEYSDNI